MILMNNYPRETVEFMPIAVAVDGETVTSGVEFTVTTGTARPTDWAAPTTLDDAIGIMIEDLDAGVYHAWARVTDTPEIPVIDCGAFRIT